MTSVISTNRAIAPSSTVPMRSTHACIGVFHCSRSSTAPPSTTAMINSPEVASAPTKNMANAASSVVIPVTPDALDTKYV